MLKLAAGLNGWKSYLLGAIVFMVGAAEMIGLDVVGEVTTANAFDYIIAGLALITGKSALKKLETPK